jgi:hypothetical protein
VVNKTATSADIDQNMVRLGPPFQLNKIASLHTSSDNDENGNSAIGTDRLAKNSAGPPVQWTPVSTPMNASDMSLRSILSRSKGAKKLKDARIEAPPVRKISNSPLAEKQLQNSTERRTAQSRLGRFPRVDNMLENSRSEAIAITAKTPHRKSSGSAKEVLDVELPATNGRRSTTKEEVESEKRQEKTDSSSHASDSEPEVTSSENTSKRSRFGGLVGSILWPR